MKKIIKNKLVLAGVVAILAVAVFVRVMEVSAANEATGAETLAANAVAEPDKEKDTVTEASKSNRVVVYYFHTSRRCRSCAVVEKMLHRVIGENFIEQAKNGKIELRAVAVDSPQNRHYIETYKLFSKAIIVSRFENGEKREWRNLDKIWRLRTEEQVFNYLREEISKFL